MRKSSSALLFPVILLFCSLFLLTGCLGPKKTDKWVAEKYMELPPLSKKKHDQILISSNQAFAGTQLSTTVKKTSDMVPLIVYWQFDYKNTCTLNPFI